MSHCWATALIVCVNNVELDCYAVPADRDVRIPRRSAFTRATNQCWVVYCNVEARWKRAVPGGERSLIGLKPGPAVLPTHQRLGKQATTLLILRSPSDDRKLVHPRTVKQKPIKSSFVSSFSATAL